MKICVRDTIHYADKYSIIKNGMWIIQICICLSTIHKSSDISIMVKIWLLSGSRHVSWSRIINQPSRACSEISVTAPPKTFHDSEAIPTSESTPNPIQVSRHVEATPSIRQQPIPSCSRSRWISQITKVVKRPYLPAWPGLCNDLTTHQTDRDNNGDPRARQSRLSKFNLDGYGDQHIQTSQLRSISIRICSTASFRYKYASFSKVASLICKVHTTPHW